MVDDLSHSREPQPVDPPTPENPETTASQDFRAIPLRIWVLLASKVLENAAAVGLLTIVGKQVFDITGREFDLGVLGLVEFVPTLVLVPFSGPIADRFDRRIVGAIGIAGFAALSFLLFWYVSTDPTSANPIFVVMFLFGVIRAFERPAVRALPIDLAPPKLVERIVALSSASWQLGIVVGPAIAGLLFTLDETLPYAVIGGMFIVAGAMLLVIPSARTERLVSNGRGARQSVRDAYEGLRFIREAPVVAGSIVLDLFAVLLGGAVALLPAIAEKRLGVDAFGLGLLRSAIGIGAGVVTLGIAVRPVRRRVGRTLLISVAIFGTATIVLGLTRNFVVAMAALAILGGADSVSVFIRSTLVPLATPEAMRGRVLALESVFIGASNELGAFESGATAALFGLVPAVLFGGFGTLAVVAGFWVFFPAMKAVDRFSDVRVDETVA